MITNYNYTNSSGNNVDISTLFLNSSSNLDATKLTGTINKDRLPTGILTTNNIVSTLNTLSNLPIYYSHFNVLYDAYGGSFAIESTNQSNATTYGITIEVIENTLGNNTDIIGKVKIRCSVKKKFISVYTVLNEFHRGGTNNATVYYRIEDDTDSTKSIIYIYTQSYQGSNNNSFDLTITYSYLGY